MRGLVPRIHGFIALAMRECRRQQSQFCAEGTQFPASNPLMRFDLGEIGFRENRRNRAENRRKPSAAGRNRR